MRVLPSAVDLVQRLAWNPFNLKLMTGHIGFINEAPLIIGDFETKAQAYGEHYSAVYFLLMIAYLPP